jgi:hypothetical protein
MGPHLVAGRARGDGADDDERDLGVGGTKRRPGGVLAQGFGAPGGSIGKRDGTVDRRQPEGCSARDDGKPVGLSERLPEARLQKILETSVIIWDYTWTTGQPTPMHFHDKDALVVYLKDGALKSTTPDGKSVVNPLTVGKTTFNARDRVHTETLVEGESRAIITELK